MFMKKFLVIVLSIVMLSSCNVFNRRYEFREGMSEQRFLRQNRGAVLSSMEGDTKIYRVNREERFYVLATFQNGELIRVEEREIGPNWMQNQPIDGNNFE
jgi:hypothetical protein